jgi:hypothetical protein
MYVSLDMIYRLHSIRQSADGSELQAYQESKTFEDAETEVDNQWFVENAQTQMSTSTNNRSTAVIPAANSTEGNIDGGLFAGEQVDWLWLSAAHTKCFAWL